MTRPRRGPSLPAPFGSRVTSDRIPGPNDPRMAVDAGSPPRHAGRRAARPGRWRSVSVAAVSRIDDALTAPGTAHRLAAVRAGLAVVIALRLATGPYAELAGQPAALFRPPDVLAWLPSMPPLAVLVALQVVGTVAAGAAATGRRATATFAVAWGSLAVLAGLRGGLGKVLHNDVLLLLAAVPIMLAPAGARWGDLRSSRRWGWPVRAAMAVVAAVYFACAVQKLRHSGLDWVTGDNMRWILYSASAGTRAPTTAAALFIADRAWLAHLTAGALLATELAAPVLLAVRRTRLLFVALAALLHLGTWLTLGLDYWGWALTVAVVALPAPGGGLFGSENSAERSFGFQERIS